MKTIEEVRRERLMELRTQFGTWVKLNQMLGQDSRDSTLSQIANESTGSKTSKPKTMGSDLARRMEAVCGKERGWMDTDPDLQQAPDEAGEVLVRMGMLLAALPREARGSVGDLLRGWAESGGAEDRRLVLASVFAASTKRQNAA